MKIFKLAKKALPVWMAFVLLTACDGVLRDPLENQIRVETIDYTKTEDMDAYRVGSYATFYDLQWETFPIIAVRGDDVNASGDQAP
nr:RagB/SusD family nutrient uptake outer membrane protein [Cyclobacteriaceae bacterium]